MIRSRDRTTVISVMVKSFQDAGVLFSLLVVRHVGR